MSAKAVYVEAARLLKNEQIALAITLAVKTGKQSALLPVLVSGVRLSMEERLEELRCAARLDPQECFDELNHFKSIREMPEHVRRAIAGFEVDPVSFITKVKFVDKMGAIMNYTRLAGDIPREVSLPSAPREINPALRDMSVAQRMQLRERITQLIESTIDEAQVVTQVVTGKPRTTGRTNGHTNGHSSA
jgi:hypothetical protein